GSGHSNASLAVDKTCLPRRRTAGSILHGVGSCRRLYRGSAQETFSGHHRGWIFGSRSLRVPRGEGVHWMDRGRHRAGCARIRRPWHSGNYQGARATRANG
ncbi:unnamed protein product, partial [Sphacelaria rigidula]